jgi:hypothetical protein
MVKIFLPRADAPPVRRRSCLRYSIRSILCAVALICVWLGIVSAHARRQRRAVERLLLHNGGNWVCAVYDFQYSQDGAHRYWAAPPGPNWLRDLIGLDYFSTVVAVNTNDLGDDFAALEDLPNLTSLSIYASHLSDREIAYLRLSPHMRELSLFVGKSEVGDAGWVPLEELRDLKELSMGGGGITDAALRHISRFAKPRSLRISRMGGADVAGGAAEPQITDAGLQSIGHFTKLRSLQLYCLPNVGDNGLANLEQMAELETLDLYGDQVTDRGLEHIGRLVSLRDLNLQYTLATNQGLEQLRGLTQLTGISVLGTKITKDGLNKLKRTLPRLTWDL